MTTASPVTFEQDSNQTCADLLRFIDASPTPYHAVAESAARLAAIGFAHVSLATDFAALSPGGYFATASDGTIVAFVRPRRAVTGFRIIGAHTDSPNLRLKPRALYEKVGYLQLGVEVYGGVLLNSWLDRDLRLAGRAVVRDDDGRLKSRLVSLAEPIVRVPQLAIHLDRDVHEKGLTLNRQEHMVPILGLADAKKPKATDSQLIQELCAQQLGLSPKQIVSWELHLHDSTPSVRAGLSKELVFAPRLDNLGMCHAALSALLRTHAVDDDSGVVSVVALFDHEEVGSSSDHGAQSALLPQVLERLVLSTGGTRETYHQALARSLCASTDMSHAVHPNYVDRHEANHRPLLNGGPVIKYNSQQRYATSLPTAALMMALGQKAGIELQQYVHRTDLPCGSTIGPIVSTLLGIPTVDLGNPMLSMHSARELCGAADPELMSRLLAHFLVSRELVDAAR
ncbi:MAG: M18 family aminopeptidase [Polyangia bacterium]